MPTPLTPRSLKGDAGEEVYLGILLESEDSRIVTAAMRDIIAYRSVVNPRDKLIIVTPAVDLLKPVLSTLEGVSTSLYLATMPDRPEARIWKGYYIDREPQPPSFCVDFYVCQVTTNEKHVLRFGQGHSPVPDEPAGIREVPPGTSLTINKLPPIVNQGTPWMPWI